MKRVWNGKLKAVLLVSFLSCATALGASGIDKFTLSKAVPADASLVAFGRTHAGQSFLQEQYQRIWQVVEQQEFSKDLRTLLKGLYQQAGETDLEAFEQQWQRFSDLLLAVNWSALFEKESAFAMKVDFPVSQMVVLAKATTDQTGQNFSALEELAKAMVKMAGEEAVILASQGEGSSSVIHTITFPQSMIPLSVMLARENDVILLGLGGTLPEQTLALLKQGAGDTLAGTADFKAALERLPAPEDSFFFMDFSRFMGQSRAVVGAAIGIASATGEVDAKIQALPNRLFDAFDMYRYIASSAATQDKQTMIHTMAVLNDEANARPAYNVFYGNGPLQKPLAYVPQEAENCMTWNGLDLQALYDQTIMFIRDNAPDGEQLIATWEQQKQALPIDIEQDLLAWLSGEVRSFSMPAKSAYQSGPWVMMFGVKDEAKAREMMQRLFATLEPMLGEQGGSIRDAQIEGTEGFKVIVSPQLVMVPGLGTPTLGVAEQQLFFGTNEQAIATALATANGRQKNFEHNERFKQEGLEVPSEATYVSFTDQTKLGEQLSAALQMAPMLTFMVPELGQSPLGRTLVGAAAKLGRVVSEFNFLQSTCTVTTFDGKVDYTKQVVNYREPPKKDTGATGGGTQTSATGE